MENADELAGAFAEAAGFALRELAGVEAILIESRSSTCFGDISATLQLGGNGDGFLVFSVSQPTAEALAKRILAQAMSANEIDAVMVRDCMGEVANIVAGQAKTLLYGTPLHFTFSAPKVLLGPPPLPIAPHWIGAFCCEVGEFALHVRMPAPAAVGPANEQSVHP